MTAENLVELEERHVAHNYEPLDVVLERGHGVWVWDIYGRRYLDCLAGYSAVSQSIRSFVRCTECEARQSWTASAR